MGTSCSHHDIFSNIARGTERIFGKGKCNTDHGGMVNAMNQIISMSVVKSVNNCDTNTKTTQTFNLFCNPIIDPNASYTVYEGNPSCTDCIQGHFDAWKGQVESEKKLWTSPQQTIVRQDINKSYNILINGLSACGINTCKACSIQNVNQSNMINISSDCNNIEQVQKVFNANVRGLVSQQLTQNQDILASAMKTLVTNNANSVIDTISTSISSKITTNTINNWIQNAFKFQNITLKASGTVVTNNISQANIYNSVVESVSKTDISSKVLDELNFQLFETIINSQQTLNSVGETVFKSVTGFLGLIDGIVGRVLVATAAILGLVVFVIVFFIIYKIVKSRKNSAKKQNQYIEDANQLAKGKKPNF